MRDFKNKGNAFEGVFGGSSYYRFSRWFGIGPEFYRKGLGGVRLQSGMKALDLGCGPGALCFVLAEVFGSDILIRPDNWNDIYHALCGARGLSLL